MPDVIRPDGASIHYQRFGAGEPLLALAPGPAGGGVADWTRARLDPISALADTFEVIAVDTRYSGSSRAPLVSFSWDQALGDLLAVLDDAGIGRAVVLGEDLGALAALRLVYEAPARVRRAVLIEPPGLDASNRMDTYYARFNETIRMARGEGLDGVIAAARRHGNFADAPAAGPWAARLRAEAAFQATLRGIGRENYIALIVDFRDGMFPWQQRYFSVNEVSVARLEAPLLVVPGDDELHPPGVAAALAASAPRGRVGRLDELRPFLVADR